MPNETQGYTVDEIVDDVQTIIGNDSTAFNTYLLNRANDAQREICNLHDWSFLHTTGSITVTADSATGTVPTGCVSIEDIVDTTNGRKLNRIELRSINLVDPSGDDKGDPTEYAVWGSTTLYFYPTPDTSDTLTCKYKQRANYMTTGVYPIIPPEYQFLIIQRLFTIGLQHETDDRYSGEYQVWKAMVTDCIRSDMIRLEGDDRIKWPQEEGKTKGGTDTNTYAGALRSWYGS